MYTREQVRALTDRIFNMASGADAVQVEVNANERSGTRWANSTITTNLVQYDRQVTITVRRGSRQGSASTRDFGDAGLREAIGEAIDQAESANENANLPEWLGAQTYLDVDAVLPSGVGFGPAARAMMVKESLDLCDQMNVVGSGYIPKMYQATCTANTNGLFAFYAFAEAGFVLTCRTPDGAGSGWAGITGIKDIRDIDATALTRTAAGKALGSVKPRAIEPGRYTVILEPRANARFLSLMTGIFNQRNAEAGGNFLSGATAGTTKIGEKVFSDLFSLRSQVGHPVLRQTPIMNDLSPAAPVTWVEQGVLRTLSVDAALARERNIAPTPAAVNMSLVMDGADQSVEDIIRTTRRGLLVTFFWYIRGVDPATLLNTGMTRDGLFLIENGEIVGPVQNFRWNMSPLVGYNNVTAVGRPVPMHMGESYDGGNTAMIPPVRIEDFYMTSVSPAV
ncbi:MAG TPA: TldD/PmbA family protein [Vicinamibacterales bacterium]|nr:TldD/PmbA family protein [Vicinamibacterales bacterium]